MGSRALWLIAAATLAGFALRYPGIHQSYFGDELFTADILRAGSLSGVLHGVTSTESTPPLYYVAGWLFGKLGDPLVWGRVPSLVCGTLAIPATWLLGRRTVGEPAALIGAGIVALAPTAIFYSSEARAYGMLLLLSTAALWLLLVALERGDRRAWAAFALVSIAALYTHYTAAFPLAAGVAWGLWQAPERRRAVLMASGAVALAYVPWLPHLGANPLLELGTPLSFESAVRFSGRLLPGHPYVTLPELPGKPALVLFALALVVAAAACLVRRRPGTSRGGAPPPLILLALVALATPAGLVLYSLLKTDIFQPRYLLASLPAYALLIGALLVGPRGRLALATSAAALAAVAWGGISTAFDAGRRRPPYNDAAAFVEAHAKPGDAVADVPLFLIKSTRNSVLDVNLPPARKVFTAFPVRRPNGRYDPVIDRAAWRAVAAGHALYVVTPHVQGRLAVPAPPRGQRVRLVRRTLFDGFIEVGVFEYRRG
ncbi:MAG: mannosyltransferase [Thermoleophilaceae bacterium]|nr:mannosyltransferase [Thermoleophilaceae bacterium]